MSPTLYQYIGAPCRCPSMLVEIYQCHLGFEPVSFLVIAFKILRSLSTLCASTFVFQWIVLRKLFMQACLFK